MKNALKFFLFALFFSQVSFVSSQCLNASALDNSKPVLSCGKCGGGKFSSCDKCGKILARGKKCGKILSCGKCGGGK